MQGQLRPQLSSPRAAPADALTFRKPLIVMHQEPLRHPGRGLDAGERPTARSQPLSPIPQTSIRRRSGGSSLLRQIHALDEEGT
jgi:hypothetical protein